MLVRRYRVGVSALECLEDRTQMSDGYGGKGLFLYDAVICRHRSSLGDARGKLSIPDTYGCTVRGEYIFRWLCRPRGSHDEIILRVD